MSYDKFKEIVNKIADKAEVDDIIVFNEDTETGKYSARFSSGIRMFGNSSSKGITVRWGTGHQAMMPVTA